MTERITLTQVKADLNRVNAALNLNTIGFTRKKLPSGNYTHRVIVNGEIRRSGLSLRDALEDAGLPVIEVHLSNIYAREEWRQRSVIAPIARGQVSGLGWRGYLAALEIMVAEQPKETPG